MLGAMTKTQYFVAASLDGFIATPDHNLDWLTSFDGAEGVAAHYQRFLSEVGVLAMGAATYEFLLAQNLEEWPYPNQKTWVFTTRALPAFPGASLVFTRADVPTVHAELERAAQGKNIWLVGGGKLAAQFAAHHLLDELWLSIVPVVLGAGISVLPQGVAGQLELLSVTQFGRGMVELRYAFPSAPKA